LLSESISTDSCLTAIAHEMQIEFFTEFGHRWFDLKRTGTAGAILGPIKSNNWQSYDTLWPVPLSQINADPFLIQNSGYK
ncbi:MAG TPA: RagB/SusD family nutrient uptake outer membrane protein, partial [Nitrosopumilaceae archaeon]|nr:RagB/SusD family nutrient uptake outer membrane protein [Nitrosopumilaceae archaeon]